MAKIEQDLLHDIFYFKCHGLNNKEVAEQLDMNRVTLQRLMSDLKKKNEDDFTEIFRKFATETQRKAIANKILQYVMEHKFCRSYHEIDGKPATCLDLVLEKIKKEFDVEEK